jgi:PAS domain S-box-containing protein
MENKFSGIKSKNLKRFEGLNLHDHACFIYSSVDEQYNMIEAQIEAAIDNEEVCLCLVEESKEEDICKFLKIRGLDVTSAKEQGILIISNAKEVYMQFGYCDSTNLAKVFKDISDEAKRKGYKGLRVINEMNWILGVINDTEKFIEYEFKINDVIEKLDIIRICQYDINEFLPDRMKTIISTYSNVIHDDEVFKNPYYISSEEYFKPDRAKMEVMRLLDSIKKSVKAEDELLDITFEHQSFIDGFTGMIFYKNLDNRFIWVNDNYVKSMGISKEILLSKSIHELFPSEDMEQYTKDDNEVIETGLAKRNIIESVVTAEGEKWARTDKVPMFNRNGEIIGIIGFAFDITEEIKLQRALKKSEELYHSIYENSPLVFGIWDKDFRFVDWNKRGEEVFGWSKEEVLGKRFVDLLIPTDIKPSVTDVAQNLLDSGISRITSNENITKDGTILLCEWHNTMLHDNEGNLVGTISLGLDKTEKHRAEKAILEAKEQAEKANNELSLINYALQKEIAERMGIEDELRKSKIEADSANMAKSQFLANMSHEIRTPMNGIMGMSELLLFGDLTDEQKEMVNIIKLSSNVLLKIINDILDLSKIEAGKVELKPEDVNIHSMISRIDALFSPITKNKNISFKITINDDVPEEICVDSIKLTQVITNLIGNAIKFTEIGQIEFLIKKVKVVDGKVELMISISDEGIGIKEEDIPKLFNYFTQLDDTKTKSFQGAGLGLAISKRLVEIMGGEICAESEIGKGSTFYFTFWADIKNQQQENSAILNNEKNKKVPKDRNILLVEDDYVSQLLIKQICKMKKWNISVAPNGKEALEVLENNKFDLILMDIQMPEMSGFDLTKIIREKENSTGEHTPIIATTAYAMEIDKEHALNVGMDDYISKPIDLTKLQEIINQVIK